MWLTAFLLGLQTSVCPCPLTANITAISYIAQQKNQHKPCETHFPQRTVLLAGLFYAAGQMIAYTAVAFCVTGISLYSGSEITRFFTATLHRWIPAVFLLIGITLIGNKQWTVNNEQLRNINVKQNDSRFSVLHSRLFIINSPFLLGAFYALAFCPTTAAMFLAMLTLAIDSQSPVAVPMLFGLGTSLPVAVLSYLLAFQIQYFGKTFKVFGKIDAYSRPLAGMVFILAGLWTFFV